MHAFKCDCDWRGHNPTITDTPDCRCPDCGDPVQDYECCEGNDCWKTATQGPYCPDCVDLYVLDEFDMRYVCADLYL
jgi:hypothetical protein